MTCGCIPTLFKRSSDTASEDTVIMPDTLSGPIFVKLPTNATSLNSSTSLPAVPKIYESHFSCLLLKNDKIRAQTKKLASLIHAQYSPDEPLVLVCVLKGASPFFQSLCDELSLLQHPYMIEFIRLSSYVGTRSSGRVTVDESSTGSMKSTCKDRNVIIVEDIVDTGTTLQMLQPILQRECQPKSIEICALVHKRLDDGSMISGDKVAVKYAGFSIPNAFIVGYGLDYNEMYRDLRDIWILGEKGIQLGGWKEQS